MCLELARATRNFRDPRPPRRRLASLEPNSLPDADGLPDAWKTAHGLDPALISADNGRLGDLDQDGIPNLLEYAFGLDPRAANPTPPTSSGTVRHPTTGQNHLVYTYRRLLAPDILSYRLVTSTDLITWAAPASPPEILSTVANPDGISETVSVRLNPAIGSGKTFVRLEITAP